MNRPSSASSSVNRKGGRKTQSLLNVLEGHFYTGALHTDLIEPAELCGQEMDNESLSSLSGASSGSFFPHTRRV